MSTMVNGKGVVLSLWDGTAYLPIGCLTSNGISESQEINDGEPNKCDDNVPRSQGAYSYEVNADGVMVASTDAGYTTKAHYKKIRTIWSDSRTAGTPVFWKQTLDGDTEFGKMFITSLDAEFPADGDATFSLSGSGIDAISPTDLVV